MSLTDYNSHLRKRAIQDTLFPLIRKKRMVCLGGPNLDSYLRKLPSSIKTIEVWENDICILGKQAEYLIANQERGMICNFGDILQARIDRNAFYDLDFCCTIDKALPHLERFRDCAFCITLSLRGKSITETLKKFIIAVGENKEIFIRTQNKLYNMLSTDKNKYMYTTYSDSSAMITIFKFH